MSAAHPTQKAVQIASRLYEMRDCAKRVLGDRFPAFAAECAAPIIDAAEKTGDNVLMVAANCVKRADLHGMDLILVMGSVVEALEPGEQQ